MKKLAIKLFVILMALLLTYALLLAFTNLCVWPAVTECPMCGKTIWVWEGSECRSYPLDVETEGVPDGFAVVMCATSIFHASCSGVPEGEKVWVKFAQDGSLMLRKRVLRAREKVNFRVIEKKEGGFIPEAENPTIRT